MAAVQVDHPAEVVAGSFRVAEAEELPRVEATQAPAEGALFSI